VAPRDEDKEDHPHQLETGITLLAVLLMVAETFIAVIFF